MNSALVRVWAVVIVAGCLCSVSEANLHWWVQPLSLKIQPSTTPRSDALQWLRFSGPKASFQSGQFALYTHPSGTATGVRISSSPLTSTANSALTIPARKVVLFKQYLQDFSAEPSNIVKGRLPVPANSPTADTKLPDPLVPLIDPYTGNASSIMPLTVGTKNVGFWVDVEIPKTATAGWYEGSLTVTWNEMERALEIPLTVQVWNFVLDDSSEIPTWVKNNADVPTLYHANTWDCGGGSCWNSWSPWARTVVNRYEELLHEHRLDGPVQFTRNFFANCVIDEDTIGETFEVLGAYLNGSHWRNGVPTSWWDAGFEPGNGFGSCSNAQASALAKTWAARIKARDSSWIKKALLYATDEPAASQYATMVQQGKLLIQADADWKAQIICTVGPVQGETDTLDQICGTYVVNVPAFNYWPGPKTGQQYGRFTWQELWDAGHKLWMYESNSGVPPWPTWATNNLDASEPSMMMWGNWFEKSSGFLYWDSEAWEEDDPWGPNFQNWGKSGDGILIYPGHHNGRNAPRGSPSEVQIDGPVPSLRLKMIRDGLQDWSMFRMAEKLGHGAAARTIMGSVYVQLGRCLWDHGDQGGEYCSPALGSFLWNTTNREKLDQVRYDIAKLIANVVPQDEPIPGSLFYGSDQSLANKDGGLASTTTLTTWLVIFCAVATILLAP